MLASEVLNEVRKILGDTASNKRYSDAMLIDFLNDAQMTVSSDIVAENAIEAVIIEEDTPVYNVDSPSTLTASEVITSVRYIINDQDGSKVTDSDILALINSGQREIYSDLSLDNGVEAVVISEGDPIYTLLGGGTEASEAAFSSFSEVTTASTSPDFSRPSSCFRTSTGKVLGFSPHYTSSDYGISWDLPSSPTTKDFITVTEYLGVLYASYYAAGPVNEIYKSVDDGETWTLLHDFAVSGAIKSIIAFNDGANDIIIVFMSSGDAYSSFDYGSVWDGPYPLGYDISCAAYSSGTFLIGTASDGLYNTTDFVSFTHSINNSLGIAGIGTSSTGTLFAIEDGSISTDDMVIYVSDDSGATWTNPTIVNKSEETSNGLLYLVPFASASWPMNITSLSLGNSVAFGALGYYGNASIPSSIYIHYMALVSLDDGDTFKLYDLGEYTNVSVPSPTSSFYGIVEDSDGNLINIRDGYTPLKSQLYYTKEGSMVKKINRIELLKITDSAGDVAASSVSTALAISNPSTEEEFQTFLSDNSWSEYLLKEVPVKTPNGVTWKNTTANPVQSVITSGVTQSATPTIRVYPIPDTTPEYYVLKVYFTREPEPVYLTTDTLDLPRSAKESLKYYVAAQALLSEQDQQDYNKANVMIGLYEQHMKGLRTTLKAQHFENYEIGYRR